MEKRILSALALLLAVACFNSCEKEIFEAPANVQPALANDPSKENPAQDIRQEKIDHADAVAFDPGDNVETRDGRQLIYQADITLNQGYWALRAANKSQLDPAYRYIATVSPYQGDPDLYLHGRQPGNSGAFRTIRNSRNPGAAIEEAAVLLSELAANEDRLYFNIYAQTNTRFILQIFREPACAFGCTGFLANENWTEGPYYGTKGNGSYFADVNGDLKADAIVVNGDFITVRRSTGSGFASGERWTDVPYYGTRGTFFADVTGDLRADAIVVNDNFITVRRSTGNGFAPNERWTDVPYYGTRGTFFADVTGDGKADAIVVNDNFITVRRSTGSGFAPNERWTDVPFYGTLGYNSAYFADVTGDGKADAIVISENFMTVRRSTGSGFAPNERWTDAPFYATIGLTQFADLNGDSKADAIAVTPEKIMARRSGGNAFVASENWTDAPYYGARGTYFADVNGDLKADAIAVNNTGIIVKRSR